MQENSKKRQGNIEDSLKCVFVSDLHITTMADYTALTLLALIDYCAKNKTEYFVLGGDVFDFCFGGSSYFRNKFKLLGDALTRLSRTGTNVYFIEGNHEFYLKSLNWHGVNFKSTENLLLDLIKYKVKFAHGDLLTKDKKYLIYRNIVRSKWFLSLVRLIPGKILDLLALNYANKSRSISSSKVLNHNRILKFANEWLSDDDCEYGVFGHFHFPYSSKIANKHILSVKCWENPNALFFTDYHIRRVSLALFENSLTITDDPL